MDESNDIPYLTDPDQTDYTTVGSAVTTISSNLSEMTKGLKLMAALLEDDSIADNLLKVKFTMFILNISIYMNNFIVIILMLIIYNNTRRLKT